MKAKGQGLWEERWAVYLMDLVFLEELNIYYSSLYIRTNIPYTSLLFYPAGSRTAIAL